MNFYAFHIGDYASATAHLSIVEDGVYRRLLDIYYTREAPIPADLRQACRLVRAQLDSEREAVEIILNEFFNLTPEGWRHARCDEEISRANEKKGRASASAAAKWESPESLASVNAKKRSERLALARAKGTHTEREWSAILQICGFRCLRCDADKGIVKDHIVPIYQGGSDGVENLQPLCRSCNSRKGPDSADLRPSNWRERLRDICGTPATSDGNACETVRNACGTTAPNPNPNPNPKEKKQHSSGKPDQQPGFARFWESWPRTDRKVARAECAKRWKAKGYEAQAERIVAHVEAMKRTKQWQDGYEPAPLTFINQQRWEDNEAQAPPVDAKWWVAKGYGDEAMAIRAGHTPPGKKAA